MSKYVVNKIDTKLAKDQSGNIIQRVVYNSACIGSVNVVMFASVVKSMPDVFEVIIRDGSTINEMIKAITSMTTRITFTLYNVDTCPICGKPLIHENDGVVCLNIDCINNNDDGYCAICNKFLYLAPGTPAKFLLLMMSRMRLDSLNVGVLTLVRFVESFVADFDEETASETDLILRSTAMVFIKELKELSVSRMIGASINHNCLDNKCVKETINYYQDTLINMIIDIPTVFEAVRQHGVSADVRIWFAILFNANEELIDWVLDRQLLR